MNEIFKELWNLNIKQTFLLIAFIVELLFLTYAFLVYCYEKNETLKLITFIKKNIFLSILLLTIPAVLLLLVFILKDTFSLDGWLSFLGGYFGVIGAIGGIWWQLHEGKKKEYLECLNLFKYYLEFINKDGKNIKNRLDLLKNFIDLKKGATFSGNFLFFSDSKLNLLRNEFFKISSLKSGKNILEILDILEDKELTSRRIINDSIKIKEKYVDIIDMCKKYFEEEKAKTEEIIFNEICDEISLDKLTTLQDFDNLTTKLYQKILCDIFSSSNFKNVFNDEEYWNIINGMVAIINHLHNIGHCIYDPDAEETMAKISNCLKEIDSQINQWNN